MISNPIVPVILCGGSGSRLWPLSRESYPKQYLNIGIDDSKSLLQKTQSRILNIENIKSPILVCNENHRFIVAEQMRKINIENFTILLEPFGKNTGPAIALAALKAIEQEEDPILLVLSSDHEIINEEKFLEVIKCGINFAINERLVTFGIVPTSPETGYGYIKASKALKSDEIRGENIEKFLEKPNLENAKKFISDKKFTWNSGMFMFKAKTILQEIDKYSPQISKYCKESFNQIKKDLDFQRLDRKAFEKCPNISIDIAVMEKTNIGTVLPLDAGWSDVGDWKSVWEISEKDNKGNFQKGKVVTKNTSNCYLRSEKRLIVGIGLSNLILVETNDAILVANKNDSQTVKEVVDLLKQNHIPEGQKHKQIYRPWGHYESLVEDSRWQVKLIEVKPGENLSLQMHHHRSEHWVVVKGTAKVEVDERVEILSENQSIYIPLGSKHRLMNPGKIPLTLIEVQSGSYVGEDDIVRIEDDYGRIEKK